MAKVKYLSGENLIVQRKTAKRFKRKEAKTVVMGWKCGNSLDTIFGGMNFIICNSISLGYNKLCVVHLTHYLITHEFYGHCAFLPGETDAAKAMLTHCLDQDPTFSDAHLLMAQVS